MQEPDVLCDNHDGVMERREYQRRGSIDGAQSFWVCPNCQRHFGIGQDQGYFDMLNGKVDASDRRYEACEDCGHAKAILRIGNEKPDWKCLHCLKSKKAITVPVNSKQS